MGLSRQECWSGLPFPSPVEHVLSELSRNNWVLNNELYIIFRKYRCQWKNMEQIRCLENISPQLLNSGTNVANSFVLFEQRMPCIYLKVMIWNWIWMIYLACHYTQYFILFSFCLYTIICPSLQLKTFECIILLVQWEEKEAQFRNQKNVDTLRPIRKEKFLKIPMPGLYTWPSEFKYTLFFKNQKTKLIAL